MPDVGYVAAPHLVWALDRELAVQSILDSWSLNRGLFVSVRTGCVLTRFSSRISRGTRKTANRHIILAQHAQDVATAGRAPALAE